MTAIKRIFGTAIGFTMVLAFTLAIITLVASLAAQSHPALYGLGADIRCLIGIPKDGSRCVADKLSELEDERRSLVADRKKLGDVIAAQDFVFIQGPQIKDRLSIVVGTLYQDAGNQSGLIRSFCWAVIDAGGLDPRVGLAVLHGDGRLEAAAIGPNEAALLEMSAAEIDEARKACPFPAVP